MSRECRGAGAWRRGLALWGLGLVGGAPGAAMAGLSIQPGALGLYPGDAATLRAVSTQPSAVTAVSWTRQCGQLSSAASAAFKGDQRVFTAPTSSGVCLVSVTTTNAGAKGEYTETAHLSVSVDPASYLSLSTSAQSVPAGGAVQLDVDLTPPPGVSDSAALYASGGSLAPVNSLTGETTWVWTAPAEAGVYTLTAASALHPERVATAQVTVAGEPHINFPAGRTVVMGAVGDTASIEATVIGADGLPIKGAAITYQLLQGEGVELSGDGVVTAVDALGSATVEVTAEGVAPRTVSVLIGELKAGARVIDQRWVSYTSPGQVVLALGQETEGISVGDVILTSEGGGILARVLSQVESGPALVLGVEEAALTDVFAELRAELVGGSYVEGGAAQLTEGTTPAPPVTFDCESLDGQGVGVAFDLGLIREVNLTPHASLVIEPGGLPLLELYEGGSVMVGLQEPSMEFSEGVTVGTECTFSFPALPGPSIPLGPVLLGFTHTFSVGASVEATVGGTLKIIGPNVRTRVEDIKMGVSFNGIFWAPLGEYTVAESFSGYEGADPFEASLGFSAETQIFASLVTGIGVSPAGKPLAYLDFLDTRSYGYLGLSEDLPFDWRQPTYRGPVPEMGVGTSADFGPFFDSPMIGALLRLVGIEDLLSLEVSIYDHQWPLMELEDVTLSADPDGSSPPQSVDLSVVATDWQEGCVVHFESFDPQAPEVPTGRLASSTLDAAGAATVTVPWPAQRTEVLAVVYQLPFTVGDQPYGSNRVVIGGTPCDGPECQNTVPAGGPGQSSGVGGGGGFGDPMDNGGPDQTGSIGGPSGGPWQLDGGLGGGWPGNPEGTGGSTADPHLVSFDGLRFNMQAPGEYILSWGLDEAGELDPLADFGVQVRQTPVLEGGQGAPGAVNTAAGVRMGDHDVAIYAAQGQAPLLTVDGQAHPVVVGQSLALGVGRVMTQSGGFLFVWDSGAWVRVRVGWAHLDVTAGLSEAQSGAVAGLLGDYDADPEDDFMLRDGTWLPRPINHHQLYEILAPAWRVGEADVDLLDDTLGAPVPDLPGFPGPFSAANVTHEEWLDARDRCAAGGVDFVGALEACAWDVAVLLHAAAPLELITSIIEAHAHSQHDLFGQGEAEVYFELAPATLSQGEALPIEGVVIGDASQLSWEASCGELLPQPRGVVYVAPFSEGVCEVSLYQGGALVGSAQMTILPGCLDGWTASAPRWTVVQEPCRAALGVTGAATPDWFISPEGGSYIDVEVRGTLWTHTNSMGAQIGLVVGFDPTGEVSCADPEACELHMMVFDWWQAWLPSDQREAWISRVDGVVDLTDTSLWGSHSVVPGSAFQPLVGLNTSPWPRGVVLDWRVIYSAELMRVTVWNGQTQLLDISAEAAQVLPAGETFQPGRVGFYERAEHGDAFTITSITPL